MKHHPPHHHSKICATYSYMENDLLIIDHKILHNWANAVLTPIRMVVIMPIHTVAITQSCTVLQGCVNVVRMYRDTNTTTVI